MVKRILWLVLIVILAVFCYTTVLPYFNRPPQTVDAPEHSKAILHYANSQMAQKYFNLPANTISYKIEEVIIHSMEDIPGPHNRKKTTATLSGVYKTPPQGNLKNPVQTEFSSKLVFSLGRRYPDGIDVQLIRFP